MSLLLKFKLFKYLQFSFFLISYDSFTSFYVLTVCCFTEMDLFGNFSILPHWRWDWQKLCGPDGLKLWSPKHHDLGLCFQAVFLQFPAYALLAIVSAYFFGRHVHFVSRGKSQLIAINIRCFLVLLLTIFPLIKMYIALNENEQEIEKMFYCLCVVEGFAWFIHLGYNLALRNRLGLSARGPVSVCVLWTIIGVLSVISLRSHFIVFKYSTGRDASIYFSYAFSIVNVILQCLYALTLIPNIGETVSLEFSSRFTQVGLLLMDVKKNIDLRF